MPLISKQLDTNKYFCSLLFSLINYSSLTDLFILVQSAVSISHAQKEFQVLFDTNGQYKVIVDKHDVAAEFFNIFHNKS